MKKTLLLLSLVYCSISAFGQTAIPNGGFEQWTSSTFDNPVNYPYTTNLQNLFRYSLPFNLTKTTDAYHGSYAVQLTTNANATDTSFAYFLNFDPSGSNGNPNSWHGGMPYNQQATGIRGYYKYNVAVTDSATVIVVFSKAGANVGTYFFTIGGIQNTYKLFNFNFTPALTVVPDSVIFGVLSAKMGNQGPHGVYGCILKIDSVSFTGVNSQPALMNGDFETWHSDTINTPNNWYVQGGMGEGFSRTTDAKAGTYAMELKTFLGSMGNQNNNHPAARLSQLSNGYYGNCNGYCPEMGGIPFSNLVDTLAFWYKYAPQGPQGSDSAEVILTFKKNGSIMWSAGAEVALHAASTYQYKEIPFSITGSAPDSVLIDIQSSAYNDTLTSFVGSDLKIDGMHFKTMPVTTNIFNYTNENAVNIFPNPAKDKIQIQSLGFSIQLLEIYNVLGEKVYTSSNLKQQVLNEIDLSAFQKGIYFVKIDGDSKTFTRKIVVQ